MYSLVFAGLLLVQSVQNAVVNSPAATLFPAGKTPEQKQSVFASGLALQCALCALVSLIGLVLFPITIYKGMDAQLVLASSAVLAAIGMLSREYVRGWFYLRLRPAAALRSDAIFVLAATVVFGLLMYTVGIMRASFVLAGIGCAGLLSGIFSSRSLGAVPSILVHVSHESLAAYWKCAKWALPSVVVSWAYANAFLYVVVLVQGKAIVADIAAARLLLIPLSLLVVGWSSVFRPRASYLLSENRVAEIDRFLALSVIAFVVVGLTFGTMLLGAMPFIEAWVLGEKYHGLQPLLIAWTTYFIVASVRTIGMSAMLASAAAFRPLFYYGLLALGVAVPGVFLASRYGSASTVILSLTLAESLLAGFIWFRGWPRIRNTVLELRATS